MANIRAYFTIAGFAGHPSEVTKILGIEPDDSAPSGERRKRQAGGGYYDVKESFWEIRSGIEESNSIEDYIEDLVQKIKEFIPRLANIPGPIKENAEFNIVVVIGIRPEAPLPGLILRPDTMNFLSQNGITLVFDMN